MNCSVWRILYAQRGTRVFFVFLAFLLLSCLGTAQTKPVDVKSWEPDDLKKELLPIPKVPNPARVFQDAALDLIDLYQSKIGPLSIQRCPFTPSCSNFARQVIEQYGFLIGLSMFIDRNMYRENQAMFQHYNLRKLSMGVLKLDDRFFLGGVHE